MEDLKVDLSEAKCITILIDASNHGSDKIFPILERHFQSPE